MWMPDWMRAIYCPHEEKELAVTASVVTAETVQERCAFCKKPFGPQKTEL